MTVWWAIILVGSLGLAVWLAWTIWRQSHPSKKQTGKDANGDAKAQPAVATSDVSHPATSGQAADVRQSFTRQAELDVEHIFNDQFREELRNRGRLHFEKIIGENAMFLQQDLRLTTSQLNDYMKEEISSKLKEEFEKYEQSIIDAKEMAIDSIEKTKLAVEENRRQLLEQLKQEYAEEKAREIKRFNENMTDVVNHYLVAAIGDQIDLSDQLEYILGNLEANKQAIIQDLVNGA